MSEIITAPQLVERTRPIQGTAQQLIEQAERAEITDSETVDRGADLAKLIKVRIKAIDEERKALVQPLNDHVKLINGRFREILDPLKAADAALASKLTAYIREQERQRQAADRERRRAAEEEAIAAAERHQESGDSETAEAVLEAASTLPDDRRSAPVRGSHTGATLSTRKVWKLRVTDAEKLPKWAVIGHPVRGISLRSGPQPMLELDVPAIRDWLQKHDPAPVGGVIRSIPGLYIYQDIETAVR